MSEKILKLGLSKEDGWSYFLRGDNVYRRKIGVDLVSYSKSEVVISGLEIEDDYWYFIDKEGDISRSKRPQSRPEK
tara:strand:+ start:86 stop:313 length:228 start_codon:yes stop_codon:yes gene_type:complete